MRVKLPIRSYQQIFSNSNTRRDHHLKPSTIKIKLLKLVFLEGISHGFDLPTLHHYHLYIDWL